MPGSAPQWMLHRVPPKEEKKPVIGKFTVAPTSLVEHIGGMSLYEATSMGLPELLIEPEPNEDPAKFAQRQDTTLKNFVENSLWLIDRGRKKRIELIPQQVELLADFFYRRVTKGIVWKNRGGGGTLCASITMWLTMVWRHFSWVSIAGNAEQAKQGYGYTFQFWECLENSKKMLAGEPLQSMTTLKDGTYLKCLTNSEKSARSKHPPGLVCDEACQDDPRKDKNIESALQMVLSNTEYSILVLSTFHHARGLFQKLWDTAPERGFKRYKWDQFDTLKKCTFGMDKATLEDPKALVVCQSECPLTLRRRQLDKEGETTGWKFVGCNGRARTTVGYLPRENAIDALRMNDQETANVEHWCERPSTSGPIYDGDRVDAIFSYGILELTDEEKRNDLKVVGIDWGLIGQTAIIGPFIRRQPDGEGTPAHIAAVRESYFTGDSIEEITSHLLALRKELGYFKIFSDRSHPFNNLALEQADFAVEPVDFGAWKEFGIKNVARWIDHGAFRCSSDMIELRRTLKAYHRGPDGKPVKKDDHGPDATLVGLINWLWEQENGQSELVKTGDTDVHVFKRDRVLPAQQVVPPPQAVLAVKVSYDEPKLFRLRSGVAWITQGVSGKTYKFRGRVPTLVHFVADVEQLRTNQALEEVT